MEPMAVVSNTAIPTREKAYSLSIPTTGEGGIVEHEAKIFISTTSYMAWHSDSRKSEVVLAVALLEGSSMSLAISSSLKHPVIRHLSSDGIFAIPWSDIQTLATNGAQFMQLTVICHITHTPLIFHRTDIAHSTHYDPSALAAASTPPGDADDHDIEFTFPCGRSLYADEALLRRESPVFRRFFDALNPPDSLLDAPSKVADFIPSTDTNEHPRGGPEIPSGGDARKISLQNVPYTVLHSVVFFLQTGWISFAPLTKHGHGAKPRPTALPAFLEGRPAPVSSRCVYDLAVQYKLSMLQEIALIHISRCLPDDEDVITELKSAFCRRQHGIRVMLIEIITRGGGRIMHTELWKTALENARRVNDQHFLSAHADAVEILARSQS